MQKIVLHNRHNRVPYLDISCRNIITTEDEFHNHKYGEGVFCESKIIPNGVEIKTCRQYTISNNGYLNLDRSFTDNGCGCQRATYYPLISQLQIPPNVTKLSCSHNQLKYLPELPSDLIYLKCRANQITSLPRLPDGLIYLDCAKNNLTSLPSLPDGLLYLDCDSNNLSSLPKIPASLEVLICNDNLSESPEIPNTLKYLVIRPAFRSNGDFP